MSLQAMVWALSCKIDRPAAKLLLISLANYAGEDGRCFPTQRRLCDDTGLSERAVKMHLADLEADGLIARQKRTRSDGSRMSDLYVLSMVQNLHQGVQNSTDQGANFAPGGAPIAPHEPVIEPITEPLETTVSKTRADVPAVIAIRPEALFEVWYREYPHKVQRSAAERAFPKAFRLAGGLEPLMTGLAAYKRAKPPDVPWRNPATWLNGQGWLDQPDFSPNEASNVRHRSSQADDLRAEFDLQQEFFADHRAP